MPNYRGGPREINHYTQQAIDAVKRGTTRSQQSRDFNEKVLMGGAQAMLTGVAGGLKGTESMNLQRKQAADANNAKLAAPSEFTKARGEAPAEMAAPAWLGEHGEGNASLLPHSPEGIKSLADAAIANQSTNSSAQAAPLATWYTPQGLDQTANDAAMQNADLNVGKDMMKMGGMMNSLPRVPR